MKLVREHFRGTPRLLVSIAALAIAAGGLGACSVVPSDGGGATQAMIAPPPPGPPHVFPSTVPSFIQTGLASWYGSDFHKKQTASGERFDMNELTCAHRSLPLDTMVRVTNLTNGHTVMVRVNDRGPFTPGRVIDVSRTAARLLDMTKSGVVPVRIEVFDTDQAQNLAEAPAGAPFAVAFHRPLP